MPQITLQLSKNIDISRIDFKPIFIALHTELGRTPNTDVSTLNSGVVQEQFSYIGLGDELVTKVYLEVLWLESSERAKIKKDLGEKLVVILDRLLVPLIVQQGLICVPRVRVADLGVLGLEYHISHLDI